MAHTNCRAHDERLNFEFCVFTALEDSLFYTPKSTYLAVVAIDFGTTYSGFAFSFIKDQGKDAIFMNMDWVNEQGGETRKTPTCLLLKSDLSFDSFGYEAIEKYAGLEGEGGEKEYLFFKHFKMALYHDEVCLLDHFFMYMYVSGGRGGGEGDSVVFHLRFLTHFACQYDVTKQRARASGRLCKFARDTTVQLLGRARSRKS